MRGIRLGKRRLLFLLLALSCAGLLGGWLILNSSEVQNGRADGRILPSEVTLDNLEAFQEQMHHDLPIGTSKQEVEAYLTRWGIRHTFVASDPIYGEYKNSFHCVLDDIGSRNLLRASLSFWIVHDENDKVRAIWFREQYK